MRMRNKLIEMAGVDSDGKGNEEQQRENLFFPGRERSLRGKRVKREGDSRGRSQPT
jgi:hypothetical protein